MSETISVRSVDQSRPSEQQLDSPTRFLARQPILGLNSTLYGYELSYRGTSIDPLVDDPDKAAQQVIDNYILLMPQLDQAKGFVQCTRDILVNGLATLLPRRNTVLEVAGTIEPDADVIAGCRSLRKIGYRLALDDFSTLDTKQALLDFADYLKVDYRAHGVEARSNIHAMAQQSRIDNKVIAKGIGTAEELAVAKAEGCQLFMGDFLRGLRLSPTASFRVISLPVFG